MGPQVEIVAGDNGDLARILNRLAQNDEVIGALGDLDADAANALSGVKFREVRAGGEFGVAASLCLPLSAPGAAGDVADNGAISMSGSPNNNLKPTRLIIDATSYDFEVNDFTIAGQTQFLGTGSVPGRAFSSLSIEKNWDFKSLRAGLDAVVTGVNRSGAANVIFGTIFGKSTQV